ncbi:MAG: methionine synthase [Phycisphaerales bacterium]|nr:methionine synthase [Phycisphaerales bacterium]
MSNNIQSSQSSSLLRQLEQRVLIADGAMGTALQGLDLQIEEDYLGRENCVDVLVRSRPELIQSVHESFLEVGCDLISTDSFGANVLTLNEFDKELTEWCFDLNREAATIARAAADRYSTNEKPRFVLGSMGPGTKLISLGQVSWNEMVDSYQRQANGLIAGGVDAFLIETCQDLLQTKCAINACLAALDDVSKSATDIPIFVSVTIEATGTMLLGTEISAAISALRSFPIAALGLNCATGPTEMSEHLSVLSKRWDRHILVMPNAGLPVLVEGKTQFPLRPEPFARSMLRFIDDYGVSLVGGCCGTTPDHLSALVEGVGNRSASVRVPEENRAGCTSLYQHVDYKQELSILTIAERTNANGSRKFKRLLDEEDWDGLVSMAREEVRGGGQALDVCVDFVGRNGVADMQEVASRFAKQIQAPLMLDSTDAAVLRAGLERCGGKCIVNSINLEDGEKRFDDVCPLLQEFGAGCVALTIDEDPQAGMAKTAQRKLEIAERMHDLYVNKWGLDERDLMFDPLTFTIATGMEADRRLGLETLEGISLIAKRFPECGIILGLSNISFGLLPAARQVLNSVFLHEAVERGLTAAILHASKIRPRNRIDDDHWQAALWLIHNSRDDRRPEGMDASFDPLVHFIGLFEDAAEQVDVVEMATLSIEQRLHMHIVNGELEALAENLDEALKEYGPLEIINKYLLGGMKEVGELFGSGQMQLPFVLQSAQVMKKAVAYLEPYMDKSDNPGRATVVLATVAGDVHDIGKNLVDIILSNNGYTVENIGIKQQLSQIIDAAERVEADAVGMSGLLVKSVGVMEENLKELNARSLTMPVLVGGAALTRGHAEEHLRNLYDGSLYYGRDAFEALRICEMLADGKLAGLDTEIDDRVVKRKAANERAVSMREADSIRRAVVESPPALEVLPSEALPVAPFWGERLVEGIDLEQIYPFINKVALFRGQWGFRKGAQSPEEDKMKLEEIAEPTLKRLQDHCRAEKILRPQVVYGFFPCNRDGDDLVVFDPEKQDLEIERFSFPRQEARQRRCISDFFLPLDSGRRDVVGFHCVTMGAEIDRQAKQLFERNEYTEYLYLHGLGVEATEALAELWHKRMRAELGIGDSDATQIRQLFTQKYRGSRYSFGYPACPEMSDQEKLFRLIRPERIGCVLTENFQIDPEQSTSAIVVHHPAAKYFNV